jgi:hypothetical protein
MVILTLFWPLLRFSRLKALAKQFVHILLITQPWKGAGQANCPRGNRVISRVETDNQLLIASRPMATTRPPNSPDLAPLDTHFIEKLKHLSTGMQFTSAETTRQAGSRRI